MNFATGPHRASCEPAARCVRFARRIALGALVLPGIAGCTGAPPVDPDANLIALADAGPPDCGLFYPHYPDCGSIPIDGPLAPPDLPRRRR